MLDILFTLLSLFIASATSEEENNLFIAFIHDVKFELSNIFFATLFTYFFCIPRHVQRLCFFKIQIFAANSSLYFGHLLILIFKQQIIGKDELLKFQHIILMILMFIIVLNILNFAVYKTAVFNLPAQQRNEIRFFALIIVPIFMFLISLNCFLDYNVYKSNHPRTYQNVVQTLTGVLAFAITYFYSMTGFFDPQAN